MKVLSIEQMTRLKQLVVDVAPKEECLFYQNVMGIDILAFTDKFQNEEVKAFTLQDVIELLPIENIDIRRNCHERWVISYKDEITFKSEFMIDAAYLMLIWVIENGHLKTK